MSTVMQDTMIEPPNFAYGWYTPLVSKDVKKGKLTPLAFMGNNLIAFRNDDGKVIVMDGVCPHFGADLSKGDICDGMVRCYFHGFYYDSDGQCQKGDVVKDPATLKKLKLENWVVEECNGQVFIWHGPTRTPDRPLPIKEIGWDDWSSPVTSKQRTITNSNMCYLTENIIDMQHFQTVHKWQLHELVNGPLVTEDGVFHTDIKVSVTLNAQSESALSRFVGKAIRAKTRIKFRVYSPGLAIATSFSGGTDENPSRIARNMVCIYPIDEKNVSIRVAIGFQKRPDDTFMRRLANRLQSPLFWIGSHIAAKIAVDDFDGDLKVWNNRKYLEKPKYVKEDGPILLFRKWYLRFWHQDYMHELTDPATTGSKIPRGEPAALSATQ